MAFRCTISDQADGLESVRPSHATVLSIFMHLGRRRNGRAICHDPLRLVLVQHETAQVD